MHLKQLEYFYVLAKMEHCTKAAEKLYITQPSLSHAISELEKELKAPLFEKKGRNIYLNEYGRSFLPHVEKALNELEIGKKNIQDLLNAHEINVNLGYLYNLGSHFTPKITTAFLEKNENKNIKFSFDQGNTPNLIEGLKQEKFDLVFCSYVKNQPDISFVPIIEEELVVIVPQDHPLSTAKRISLEEIAPYPFIAFNHRSGLRPIIDDIFKIANINPKIVSETEIDSAIAGLVDSNFGIAIIPKMPFLKDFNVKMLKIKDPIDRRLIYVAHMKNRQLSAAAKYFHSFVVAQQEQNTLSNF